uniref:AAA_28 domain-containing protein n=1 Tax=Panagrellus redivivus TaxID=6233 RepID=A0A7E4V873_PANRE
MDGMQTNRFGKRSCKIVLTGGPGSGKTTAQRQLFEKISKDYASTWQVFIVGEAASILYHGGVHREEMSDAQIDRWQTDMVKTIFQLESVFDNIARNEQRRNTLIICDRGALDPKVFTRSNKQWAEVLAELGTTEDVLLARYDLVLQLFTAPPENYTKSNNAYRREDYDAAYAINTKYEQVWSKHPRFAQIDNSDSCGEDEGWSAKFDKIERLVRFVLDES